MNKYMKPLILLLFSLFLFTSFGYGQSNTMYYMGTVPQSYYLNPATQPAYGFYIGLPGLSPLQTDIINSGFTISDLYYKSGSSLTLFNENASINEFIESLKETENISANVALNLASFGFRTGEMYFSFDATLRNQEQVTYPKDLLKFLVDGNTYGQVFDFSDLTVQSVSFIDFGLNVSRNFGDMLTVGVRPKIYQGIAAATVSENDITLRTSDEWVLSAKSSINLSAPSLMIPKDADGNYDFEEAELDSNWTDDPVQFRNTLGKNMGLGIDLGVHFRPVKEIELSLSLIDLGYINWKTWAYSTNVSGEYAYSIEFVDSLEFNNVDADTILDSFDMMPSGTSFRTSLNPKLFIGGRLFATPGFDISILSRTEFNKTYIDQDLIFAANLHPKNYFSMSASYSILSKGHSTLGFGLGLRLGIFNMYTILDNIPLQYDLVHEGESKYPVPVGLYEFNVRIGFNLTFGNNKERKLKQDKPLFSSSAWMF